MVMKKGRSAAKVKTPSGPMPAFPSLERVEVIQFQYFDNGPDLKQGQSRYTLKVEAYYGQKYDYRDPQWSRVLALLDPALMTKWATDKLKDGSISTAEFEFYAAVVEVADAYQEDGLTEWVRVAYIEDRRQKVRYPGQAVILRRALDKSMVAHLLAHDGVATCERFIFEKSWRPGSKKRLFFGFYDPLKLHEQSQRVGAWEAEIAATGRASGPALGGRS